MERQWTGNARRLSQADRSEIERLIWGGETFATAAAAVGCSTKSIQRFLALTGGLKRRVKERSALRLSLAEREELSRGLVAGDSLRTIATRLGRAPSTISREVAWSGRRGYRAWRADSEAIERGHRPKPAKLAVDSRLCREVERGLRAQWSPQQIAARLICDYPDDLEHARVARDDLQDALHPGARGAAQGAHGLPADGTGAATSTYADRTIRCRPAPEHDPDQRSPARGRGSRCPRALGRRSHHRKGWSLGDRDAGGALEPLCRASPLAARPHRRGRARGADAAGVQAACRAAPDADLGSRQGDG